MFKYLKNKLSNEKGFTLIEILVVISIIAILFVILLPQIDFAGDKARQAGVKTDFHTFQIGAESYLREEAGDGLTEGGLNKFLDKAMAITDGVAKKVDPWNMAYNVEVDDENRKVVVTSEGKNEGAGDLTGGADFLMATYYLKGEVGTCTAGFDSNNLETNMIAAADCGGDITVTTP